MTAKLEKKALSASAGPFNFTGASILSTKPFVREDIDYVFEVADEMRRRVEENGSLDLLKGRILVALFYEPSTRTSTSFQAAMLRLGGQVIAITDVQNSSVSKGETLADTVRCLECYGDAIVLRHPVVGSAAEAASYLRIPLLNAGDGTGEHPTQALLDCYTILSELGRLDGITVTMLGDLKHGRTVHSLVRLLALYKQIKVNYVSPDSLRMPTALVDEIKQRGVAQTEHSSLERVLADTDILYVTRVQKERFEDKEEYERLAAAYEITPDLLTRLGAKSTMRILHPLPRVNEISPEVDKDPRAAYFRQMRCGLFVRMALLALVMGKAANVARDSPEQPDRQ